jgi:hypothetical protein
MTTELISENAAAALAPIQCLMYLGRREKSSAIAAVRGWWVAKFKQIGKITNLSPIEKSIFLTVSLNFRLF